jgi:alcohol dehydrogenase class IV
MKAFGFLLNPPENYDNVDPCILADIAIVDPALTDGLPAQVTASAGFDALVHAIEAFIARVSRGK